MSPDAQNLIETLRNQTEALAAEVHNAWMQDKINHGVTSRKSAITGQEQMVLYDQLAEADKKSDRDSVITVLDAAERLLTGGATAPAPGGSSGTPSHPTMTHAAGAGA